MSARKAAIALRPAARRDVRAILVYTAEQWGVAQRDAYRKEIDRALATLRSNPRLGRSRDEIRPGLRSYPVQRHVIYDRFGADVVPVVRVMHERMDAARHLSEWRATNDDS